MVLPSKDACMSVCHSLGLWPWLSLHLKSLFIQKHDYNHTSNRPETLLSQTLTQRCRHMILSFTWKSLQVARFPPNFIIIIFPPPNFRWGCYFLQVALAAAAIQPQPKSLLSFVLDECSQCVVAWFLLLWEWTLPTLERLESCMASAGSLKHLWSGCAAVSTMSGCKKSPRISAMQTFHISRTFPVCWLTLAAFHKTFWINFSPESSLQQILNSCVIEDTPDLELRKWSQSSSSKGQKSLSYPRGILYSNRHFPALITLTIKEPLQKIWKENFKAKKKITLCLWIITFNLNYSLDKSLFSSMVYCVIPHFSSLCKSLKRQGREEATKCISMETFS